MKCDRCGRFYHYAEAGSSWKFVPDSPFTHEEQADRCAKCTREFGPVFTTQNVDKGHCEGIFEGVSNDIHT